MVYIKRLVDHAVVPEKAHSDDAGFDLSASEDVVVPVGGIKVVSTGVAVKLSEGTLGMICPRSGLAAKHGVTVLNAPGIIDAGYRGEIKVILINHGEYTVDIRRGDRIAQMVIGYHTTDRTEIVEELDTTDRNVRGLGSTGR